MLHAGVSRCLPAGYDTRMDVQRATLPALDVALPTFPSTLASMKVELLVSEHPTCTVLQCIMPISAPPHCLHILCSLLLSLSVDQRPAPSTQPISEDRAALSTLGPSHLLDVLVTND
jgi:hypothetical protein